jgi:hypothetical protein
VADRDFEYIPHRRCIERTAGRPYVGKVADRDAHENFRVLPSRHPLSVAGVRQWKRGPNEAMQKRRGVRALELTDNLKHENARWK